MAADDQRKSDHREWRTQVPRVLPKQYSLLPMHSILHKYHEKVVEYMYLICCVIKYKLDELCDPCMVMRVESIP